MSNVYHHEALYIVNTWRGYLYYFSHLVSMFENLLNEKKKKKLKRKTGCLSPRIKKKNLCSRCRYEKNLQFLNLLLCLFSRISSGPSSFRSHSTITASYLVSDSLLSPLQYTTYSGASFLFFVFYKPDLPMLFYSRIFKWLPIAYTQMSGRLISD